MNDKKNIDRLFQEKFKDFEVNPPDFVWENIESRLEEKKKRRIIPLWFKFSGVAAILIIGIFILAPYLDGDSGDNTVVIEVKDKNPDGSKRITPTDKPIRQGQNANEAVAVENEPPGSALKIKDASVPGPPDDKTGNSVNRLRNSSTANDAVADNDKTAKPENRQNWSNNTGAKTIKRPQPHNTTVAQNEAQNNNGGRVNSNNSDNKDNNAVAVNAEKGTVKGINNNAGKGNENTTNEYGVAENNTKKDASVDNNARGSDIENKEPGNNAMLREGIKIEEAIVQTDIAVDTTSVTESENELKLLRDKLNDKEKEEKAIAENNRKGKWNIKPQMAPLFFNTASEGSPINANLAANTKDFDNDLSYGVGLDYAITDRISIRSGINTVNMRYSTNDVEFYATLSSSEQFSAVVAPSGQNANLVITPAGGVQATNDLRTQTFDGALVQKIGFVEVPLEMSYKLVNRKFGVDLIGGVSTLFLNGNNISIVSAQGYNSDMGEATNINNVSFSTNIGVGFKYRIFESFQASFEPMFKYQLNTFSSNSGNFKPYFIGLYSGISFSF